LIKPAGARIRSIQINYYINSGYNCLAGLIFRDKDGNILMECGDLEPDNDLASHIVYVNEGERIIAMRSKTLKDGSWRGLHCDIGFLLSR